MGTVKWQIMYNPARDIAYMVEKDLHWVFPVMKLGRLRVVDAYLTYYSLAVF